MDREQADDIIRKAYDEMRSGFIPERPSWDELSTSQRAELSVFAHAIIATSKDIDHAIRAKLSLMAVDVAGARYDVDRVTGERDTYRKSLDSACDALRREQHNHAETIGQRNDARRELRILATLVLAKRHVDPAKIVARLEELGISLSQELVR